MCSLTGPSERGTASLATDTSRWGTNLLVDHHTRQVDDVVLHHRLSKRGNVLLGVDLADVAGAELLLGHAGLLGHALKVVVGELGQLLDVGVVTLALSNEVGHLKRVGPGLLVEAHQHALVDSGLGVADADAVVVTVETVDESLNGGLVEVAQVGSGLAGLLSEHEGLWVDEAEGVDDDLALDGLDGVDDDGDSARGELLERLLSVDVDGRQPAAEAGVGVVPADDGLWSGGGVSGSNEEDEGRGDG